MTALDPTAILGLVPATLQGGAALAAALRRSDSVALAAIASRAEDRGRDDARRDRRGRRRARGRALAQLADAIRTDDRGGLAAALLALADEGITPAAVADALDLADATIGGSP